MPAGDRTGPMGLGPRTGKALGRCQPGVGYGNPYWGRRMGRGYNCFGGNFGFGNRFRGMGAGNRWIGGGYPLAEVAPVADEVGFLEDEISYLENNLSQARNRLNELNTRTPKQEGN